MNNSYGQYKDLYSIVHTNDKVIQIIPAAVAAAAAAVDSAAAVVAACAAEVAAGDPIVKSY